MNAKSAQKPEPLFLVVQFAVCVVCWTIVVLAIEGTVSRAGFAASVVTGLVLVAITIALVRMGWIATPARRDTTAPEPTNE